MELCKQFGAGRNSVREAVKKLQAYGILYIKRADGTFVSENYNQKMLDPMLYSIILQKNSWQEFVELRSVIDIGTLNIIIQRNDITSFLPDLYRTFGELSAEMHSPEPSVDKVLELDSRFHTQIANAAQNPMLATDVYKRQPHRAQRSDHRGHRHWSGHSPGGHVYLRCLRPDGYDCW